eukprot:1159813-Pelagomonas_calceolata.AAC.32
MNKHRQKIDTHETLIATRRPKPLYMGLSAGFTFARKTLQPDTLNHISSLKVKCFLKAEDSEASLANKYASLPSAGVFLYTKPSNLNWQRCSHDHQLFTHAHKPYAKDLRNQSETLHCRTGSNWSQPNSESPLYQYTTPNRRHQERI